MPVTSGGSLKQVISKSISQLIRDGDDVIDLLPEEMARVTREDAEYHASVCDQWIDLNQIDTIRNQRFHEDALRQVLTALPAGGTILELGCGVGYDARKLVETERAFGCYVVSEIDRRLLEFAKRQIAAVRTGSEVVRFCCLDANRLLINDNQFDRVFAIAAAHHFPDLDAALSEIDRVTKPGGKIIFAIEPNRLWSAIVTALRPLYRAVFPRSAHSAADEEAEGFRISDFGRIADRYDWQLERILPVWFFAGFLHVGLEFAYRMLRLKRRIRVPGPLERAVIAMDGLVLRIPGFRSLAWHYTVTYRKRVPLNAR